MPMKIKLFTLSLLFTLILSGCNLGKTRPSQQQLGLTVTSIAKTIYATVATQIVAESAAPQPTVQPTEQEPTGTPTPGFTPTPQVIYIVITPIATDTTYYYDYYGYYDGYSNNYDYDGYYCDNAMYVSDVTIEDYTEIYPGDTFSKTWKIKNTGHCTWDDDYEFDYVSGKRMSGDDIYLDEEVEPGETINITVDLVAPDSEGVYKGYWRMVNSNGDEFGDTYSVIIDVDDDADANTPTKTRTPTHR